MEFLQFAEEIRTNILYNKIITRNFELTYYYDLNQPTTPSEDFNTLTKTQQAEFEKILNTTPQNITNIYYKLIYFIINKITTFMDNDNKEIDIELLCDKMPETFLIIGYFHYKNKNYSEMIEMYNNVIGTDIYFVHLLYSLYFKTTKDINNETKYMNIACNYCEPNALYIYARGLIDIYSKLPVNSPAFAENIKTTYHLLVKSTLQGHIEAKILLYKMFFPDKYYTILEYMASTLQSLSIYYRFAAFCIDNHIPHQNIIPYMLLCADNGYISAMEYIIQYYNLEESYFSHLDLVIKYANMGNKKMICILYNILWNRGHKDTINFIKEYGIQSNDKEILYACITTLYNAKSHELNEYNNLVFKYLKKYMVLDSQNPLINYYFAIYYEKNNNEKLYFGYLNNAMELNKTADKKLTQYIEADLYIRLFNLYYKSPEIKDKNDKIYTHYAQLILNIATDAQLDNHKHLLGYIVNMLFKNGEYKKTIKYANMYNTFTLAPVIQYNLHIIFAICYYMEMIVYNDLVNLGKAAQYANAVFLNGIYTEHFNMPIMHEIKGRHHMAMGDKEKKDFYFNRAMELGSANELNCVVEMYIGYDLYNAEKLAEAEHYLKIAVRKHKFVYISYGILLNIYNNAQNKAKIYKTARELKDIVLRENATITAESPEYYIERKIQHQKTCVKYYFNYYTEYMDVSSSIDVFNELFNIIGYKFGLMVLWHIYILSETSTSNNNNHAKICELIDKYYKYTKVSVYAVEFYKKTSKKKDLSNYYTVIFNSSNDDLNLNKYELSEKNKKEIIARHSILKKKGVRVALIKEAVLYLANYYLLINFDKEIYMKYCNIALENDYVEINLSIGHYYQYIEPDEAKMYDAYMLALENQIWDAAYLLGKYHSETTKDVQIMISMYIMASENKVMSAVIELARYYYMKKNYEEMAKYCKIGMEAEEGESFLIFGKYLFEKNNSDKNACNMFYMAYNNNYPEAIHFICKYLKTNNELIEMNKKYDIAIRNKHSEAYTDLGNYYYNTIKNIPQALEYFNKAIAIDENKNAHFYLAKHYYISDVEMAIKHYKLSNNKMSHFELGKHYYKIKDYKTALTYLNMGLKVNFSKSITLLIEYYTIIEVNPEKVKTLNIVIRDFC